MTLIGSVVWAMTIGYPAQAQAPHATLRTEDPTGELLLPGDEPSIVGQILVGGSVHLGPGTFTFPAGWRSESQYELRGAGKDLTILRFQAPGHADVAAISWYGQGAMLLSGLTIEWVADAGVEVGVQAANGHVELRDVAVRGAAGESAEHREIGVLLSGNSFGRIYGSELTRHGHYGLSVRDEAHVVVEGTRITGNALAGLSLAMNAVATIFDSMISHNYTGVVSGGEAWFTITDSGIVSNKSMGVEGYGRSSGLIVGSVIMNHPRTGLAGNDSFWLTVVGSSINHNGTGISSYGGQPAAKFTVVHSSLERNEIHGISTGVTSSLAVLGNHIRGTGASGVAFGAVGRGSVVANTVMESGHSGIMCNFRTHGPILENALLFNQEFGFVRVPDSRCREHGSVFEGNGLGDSEVWRPE